MSFAHVPSYNISLPLPPPRTPSSAQNLLFSDIAICPPSPLPPGHPRHTAHLKLPALQSTKWVGTALFPGLMDACLNTGAVCIAAAHCMLNTVL